MENIQEIICSPHTSSRKIQNKRRWRQRRGCRFLIGSTFALAVGGCLVQQVLNLQDTSGNRRTTASTTGIAMNRGITVRNEETVSSLPTTGPKRGPEKDMHLSHLTILPLQDWEEASLRGLIAAATVDSTFNRSTTNKDDTITNSLFCQPPPGIPPQCCLGTFAGMGRIVPNPMRQQCAHSSAIQTMRELPTLVEQILEPPPVDDHHEDGLLENTGCDVCVVLQYLQRRNQSLTFLGDSMTHQTVQGLVCEL